MHETVEDRLGKRAHIIALASKAMFCLISLLLSLLALGLIVYAGSQLYEVFSTPESAKGQALLDSVGYAIIAVAVFEVAKFLFEEEVLASAETGHASEARRSITKFVSTITIAVFLEALVAIFQTSKSDDVSTMIYPTILLFAGVALIVGLGAYQRLSASAEREVEKLPEHRKSDEERDGPDA